MKQLNFQEFKQLHNVFRSISTWTKEKHAKKDEFLKLINKYNPVIILCSHKNPNYLEIRHVWDFIVYKVPATKTGKMITFRGNHVVLMNIGGYGLSKIVSVIPVLV